MKTTPPTTSTRLERLLSLSGKFATLGTALLTAALLFARTWSASAAPATKLFDAGIEAYRAGDYARAAQAFRNDAAAQPACGTLQNLGNAEWQLGRQGNAILAWEQALWVNPFDRYARTNLRYARAAAQLEAPELTWYETASTWLPMHWWAWGAGISLWLAVGATTLPGALRWRRASWQQALAAVALGIFLLTLTAHVGTLTRSRIGFILQKGASLRLTPTAGAEAVASLAAGEPAREVCRRGQYVFIRTGHGSGWVAQDQFGLICSR